MAIQIFNRFFSIAMKPPIIPIERTEGQYLHRNDDLFINPSVASSVGTFITLGLHIDQQNDRCKFIKVISPIKIITVHMP